MKLTTLLPLSLAATSISCPVFDLCPIYSCESHRSLLIFAGLPTWAEHGIESGVIIILYPWITLPAGFLAFVFGALEFVFPDVWSSGLARLAGYALGTAVFVIVLLWMPGVRQCLFG